MAGIANGDEGGRVLWANISTGSAHTYGFWGFSVPKYTSHHDVFTADTSSMFRTPIVQVQGRLPLVRDFLNTVVICRNLFKLFISNFLSGTEWALIIFVIGRLFSTLKLNSIPWMWKSTSTWWARIDLLTNGMFVMTFIFWLWSWASNVQVLFHRIHWLDFLTSWIWKMKTFAFCKI